MKFENLELRPSKKEEVAQAVPLIYSSGPPSFEYVFKMIRWMPKIFCAMLLCEKVVNLAIKTIIPCIGKIRWWVSAVSLMLRWQEDLPLRMR